VRRAPAADEGAIDAAVTEAVDAVLDLLRDGPDVVMNRLHRRQPAD
jgi:hypothetical protein